MKKSAQLRQERSAKIDAQKELRKKAEGEKREKLNVEETAQFRALQKEIDDLDADIADAEAYERNLRNQEGGQHFGPEGDGKDGEQREKEKIYRKFDFAKALRTAPKGNFDGVEKEVNDMAIEELRVAGKEISESSFHIPGSMVRASAQTVTEDSGNYGGQLVAKQTPRPVDGFLPELFLEKLGATMLTGLTGGNLPLPVVDAYDFGWYAETEDVSAQKKQMVGPELVEKRAAAVVLISNRLLNQPNLDANALVMRKLGQGAAKCLNSAAIQGTGLNNQPTGLLAMSGILAASQTSETLADWTKIVELIGLLNSNDATSESRGFLLHPTLEASLMTIKKDAGSGLFLSESGKIAGYNSVATSLVPVTPAASPVPALYPMIFGDWSQMFIGQWNAISFVVDPVTAASANSQKVTVNMGAGVAVANKKAFAVNSFLKV